MQPALIYLDEFMFVFINGDYGDSVELEKPFECPVDTLKHFLS